MYHETTYPPSYIFDMDETRLSTSPKKCQKVVTNKGKKEVSKTPSDK